MNDRIYPTGYLTNPFFTLELKLESNFFCTRLIKVQGEYHKASMLVKLCLKLIESLPENQVFSVYSLSNFLGCKVFDEVKYLCDIGVIKLKKLSTVEYVVISVEDYNLVIDKPKGLNATNFRVYRLFSGSELVYIGATLSSVEFRLYNHKKSKKEFDYVDFCELPDKVTMFDLEATLIHKYKPKYNSVYPLNFKRYKNVKAIDWYTYELPLSD